MRPPALIQFCSLWWSKGVAFYNMSKVVELVVEEEVKECMGAGQGIL